MNMITIKILNPKQIIENEKHWLISRFAPLFVDVKTQVEKAVVAELQQVFRERGIEAEIRVVKDE